MNWLYIGLPLAGFYVIWITILLLKKNYTKELMFFALAHLPYLFLNVVAPFRGIFDADYAGYNFGWLSIPQGIFVTIVAGGMAIGSFIVVTKALTNNMNGWWKFAFGLDAFLAISIALPVFLDAVMNYDSFRLELGEYLQISGVFVA